MATEEQIKARAYLIWEQEGRPQGKDLEYYLRAKQMLEAQEAARIFEIAPKPPLIELTPPTPPVELAPPSRRKMNYIEKELLISENHLGIFR